MPHDVYSVKAKIDQLNQELAFWKNALAVLSDPRMSGGQSSSPDTRELKRRYGGIKSIVFTVLPNFGQEGITTADIANRAINQGHKFTSKHPIMAINDALVSLTREEKVEEVGRNGVAKLWTKSEGFSGEGKETPA